MQRYLIILNGYTGAISGGDDHALRLLEYLCQCGHDVSVVLPADAYISRVPKTAHRLEIPVLPFERYFRQSNVTLFFIYIWRILLAWWSIFRFKPSRIDFVLIASHLFHDTLPMFLQRKCHHETVYIYHLIRNGRLRKSVSTSISIALERLSLWLIRARLMFVITSAPLVKHQLTAILNIPPEHIGMTENGVDIDTINSVPEQPLKNDIVFCGRFVLQKGVTDLIDIISKIYTLQPVSAVLIGKGPLLENVTQRINDDQLCSVTVMSDANDWNKFLQIKSSKLFVLPSYEEGWGIVIGEALACGVQVVAYDIPEIRSIWGDNVVWIPIGNKHALFNAVRELLDTTHRETKTSSYWQERLNWKHILEKEVAVIERSSRARKQADVLT